jgi:hypothetical protein
MNISIGFSPSGLPFFPWFGTVEDFSCPNRLWNASYVVRCRLGANFGSANGWEEAKMLSSQGRSNLISETVSRQGKLAKKARAQSRRVMMFISLFEVSMRILEQDGY